MRSSTDLAQPGCPEAPHRIGARATRRRPPKGMGAIGSPVPIPPSVQAESQALQSALERISVGHDAERHAQPRVVGRLSKRHCSKPSPAFGAGVGARPAQPTAFAGGTIVHRLDHQAVRRDRSCLPHYRDARPPHRTRKADLDIRAVRRLLPRVYQQQVANLLSDASRRLWVLARDEPPVDNDLGGPVRRRFVDRSAG